MLTEKEKESITKPYQQKYKELLMEVARSSGELQIEGDLIGLQFLLESVSAMLLHSIDEVLTRRKEIVSMN